MPAFPMADMEPDTSYANSKEMETSSGSAMNLDLRSNERATSELGPDSRAAKYHKSRLFGQTHRNNERLYEQRLLRDIQELRREQAMLSSLLSHSPLAQDWRAEPGSSYAPLAGDPTPKFELSAPTCEALGAYALSGRVALVMLEIIALRRNMIGWTRKRAGDVRETSSPALENVLRNAKRGMQDEFPGDREDARLYAMQQFRVLSDVHKGWAAHEGCRDTTSESDEEEVDAVIDPELEAQGDLLSNRRRRRGFGPRKCTRCKKFKHAGSGHGRSTCDDGVSVSLDIPYPAPPGRGEDRAEGENTNESSR